MLSYRERRRFTPQEYFTLEECSETKSEYYQGEIFSMSGASIAHNQIVANLSRELGNLLKESTCQVFVSDLRLNVVSEGLFTYPDLFVVCGPLKPLLGRADTLCDAQVIVEVLSKSTRRYDTEEKFRLYKGLPSFREYLLFEQDKVGVTCHYRSPDGDWEQKVLDSTHEFVRLESLNQTVSLTEVYRNVLFPEA